MGLFKIIHDGGYIMYPLLMCSILSVAIAFERMRTLKKISFEYSRLFLKASDLINEKKIHEAKGLCFSVHPIVSKPFLTVFENREMSMNDWDRLMNRRITESQGSLRRSIWLLGTIGSSAPFIGLFGTVVGIIKSFDSIALSGKSGFAVVAAGLGEALIATAAGILVAVIAIFLFNMIQVKLNQVITDLKLKVQDLRDLM